MPCLHKTAPAPVAHLYLSDKTTRARAPDSITPRQICCSAQPGTNSTNPRRAVLISLAALTTLSARQAKAGFGWDGESAALGSCALGEAGDECRRQVLLKDSTKKETYQGSQRAAAAVNVGVPVSEMSDAYTKESATLSEAIIKYGTLDPYDPQRVQIVNLLKKDAGLWTSKYARGGSVRKPSARKIYIVVDALQGHLTSNGFAPFPKKKMEKLLDDIQQAKALLADGK